MAVGTYGDILFETSDEKVFAPDKLQRSVSGVWQTHKLRGRKPRTEYFGPGLRKVTFRMTLLATLGVRPRAMLERLAAIAEGRQAYPLIIGGKPLADGPMRLVSLSEEWNTVYRGGELAAATVSVTMEEYA